MSQSIHSKNSIQAKLALLASEAANSPAADIEFSAEDLAALLDGQLAADRRVLVLDSLCSNPQLYKQWLELAELYSEASRQTVNSPVPSFNFTAITDWLLGHRWVLSTATAAFATVLFIQTQQSPLAGQVDDVYQQYGQSITLDRIIVTMRGAPASLNPEQQSIVNGIIDGAEALAINPAAIIEPKLVNANLDQANEDDRYQLGRLLSLAWQQCQPESLAAISPELQTLLTSQSHPNLNPQATDLSCQKLHAYISSIGDSRAAN